METLSRRIVFYLRHDSSAPFDNYGYGYVRVQHILDKFNITKRQLSDVIKQPKDKQILFLSTCNTYMRAGSGHSVPISLEKIAVKILSEVDVLYCCHGTTKDALSSIKDQGLSRMKRQYIHFACSKKRLRVGSEVVISYPWTWRIIWKPALSFTDLKTETWLRRETEMVL